MPVEAEEIPLSGGRTAKHVVRIGNTVRRPPTLNTEFAAAILGHLSREGFSGAPRHLGHDKQGRDILTYLDGNVPNELGHHPDKTLVAAAALIRRYHDATVSLVTSSAAEKAGIEIICHNDLSPCNAVFADGIPTGLIDFDAASPGSRAFDLGYAVWLWLDIGNSEKSGAEQVRRVRLFLAVYGPGVSEEEVFSAILRRQSLLIAEGARNGNAAMRQWATDCKAWTAAHLILGTRSAS